MIEDVPGYVPFAFAATTGLTVGFLFYALGPRASASLGARLLYFIVPFWLILQGMLAIGGVFHDSTSFPPRIFVLAVLPALLLIAAIFIFFRKDVVYPVSLRVLTLLHTVRIPVEIVLLWLAQAKLLPELMTFEGRNFDILSGLTAPIVFYFAFRKNKVNRPLLIAWNLVALALLFNVVIIAVLSLPSPMQRLAFEQPNIAVTYFPYNWLPSVVVPIVLFSHLASLWILLFRTERPAG
jgi:hypothetical protein